MQKGRLGGDGLYFAVLNLHSASQVYAGPSLSAAAGNYVSGTCHGLGGTRMEALRNAELNRRRVLAGLGLQPKILPAGISPLSAFLTQAN